MKINNLTIKQVKEIQNLVNVHPNDISAWKVLMMRKAKGLGLTDQEILKVNRGELGIKS